MLTELWPMKAESALAFTPAAMKIDAHVASLVQPDRPELRVLVLDLRVRDRPGVESALSHGAWGERPVRCGSEDQTAAAGGQPVRHQVFAEKGGDRYPPSTGFCLRLGEGVVVVVPGPLHANHSTRQVDAGPVQDRKLAAA
jgi:hypothetical protein